MSARKLTLSILPQELSVCALDPARSVPSWAIVGDFLSVTKTPDELSVVCAAAQVPESVKAERNWRALKVEGPLDFSLTGVLASLAGPLAEAKVSMFAISTYNTDYVLVKEADLRKAVEVLGEFFDIRRGESGES